MNYQSFGTLDIQNIQIQRVRSVTASDLDVDGLLTLDLDGADPVCPVLDLEDSLNLNGIKITDLGNDVMPTWLADGLTLYLRHSGAGGSPTVSHQSGSVSAAYRISNSSEAAVKVTSRLLMASYDAAASRWVVSAPFQVGDYTSSQISNSSAVTGTYITDALTTLGSYVPLDSASGLSVTVAAAPTYTTAYTFPTEASTGYTAVVDVACCDGPVTAVRSGKWRFIASFHRNSTGGAVMDGTASVTTSGGFGSMTGQVIASGNDILFQIRFSGGATVTLTREPRVVAQTPG